MKMNANFRKLVEESKERRRKIDELRVEAITGHVLMEEALDRFLEESLFHPDHLMAERLNFYLKGKLALSLSLNEDKDSVWKVFWAINELRNKIAHGNDPKVIEEKWPAPGSEDTELGVFMGPEVSHGETKVYAGVQA
jgi:hypothetical protein